LLKAVLIASLAKKRKEEDLAKRSKINDGINKYFSARQMVAPAKPKV